MTREERERIVDWYRGYLAACNLQDWAALGGFVANRVLVNGELRTRDEYVASVRATFASFPDFSWSLRRAIVEGEWLAVHLHDTGTRRAPFMDAPGDGTAVETDEFDLYRIVDDLIVEVEGTADSARLRERPGPM